MQSSCKTLHGMCLYLSIFLVFFHTAAALKLKKTQRMRGRSVTSKGTKSFIEIKAADRLIGEIVNVSRMPVVNAGARQQGVGKLTKSEAGGSRGFFNTVQWRSNWVDTTNQVLIQKVVKEVMAWVRADLRLLFRLAGHLDSPWTWGNWFTGYSNIQVRVFKTAQGHKKNSLLVEIWFNGEDKYAIPLYNEHPGTSEHIPRQIDLPAEDSHGGRTGRAFYWLWGAQKAFPWELVEDVSGNPNAGMVEKIVQLVGADLLMLFAAAGANGAWNSPKGWSNIKVCVTRKNITTHDSAVEDVSGKELRTGTKRSKKAMATTVWFNGGDPSTWSFKELPESAANPQTPEDRLVVGGLASESNAWGAKGVFHAVQWRSNFIDTDDVPKIVMVVKEVMSWVRADLRLLFKMCAQVKDMASEWTWGNWFTGYSNIQIRVTKTSQGGDGKNQMRVEIWFNGYDTETTPYHDQHPASMESIPKAIQLPHADSHGSMPGRFLYWLWGAQKAFDYVRTEDTAGMLYSIDHVVQLVGADLLMLFQAAQKNGAWSGLGGWSDIKVNVARTTETDPDIGDDGHKTGGVTYNKLATTVWFNGGDPTNWRFDSFPDSAKSPGTPEDAQKAGTMPTPGSVGSGLNVSALAMPTGLLTAGSLGSDRPPSARESVGSFNGGGMHSIQDQRQMASDGYHMRSMGEMGISGSPLPQSTMASHRGSAVSQGGRNSSTREWDPSMGYPLAVVRR